MISFLNGKIILKKDKFAIIEVAGVGYKVFVTPEALGKNLGESAEFFTYLKVSEDGQALFGLPDFATLQFFEMLITVSGVGPKVALAILSAARAEAVKQAIANQDAAIFTRISGVGTKTAEKIIVELKSKVAGIQGPGTSSEAFDALIALGYKQAEVRGVINKLDSAAPTGEQIKQALRLLDKR